MLTLALPCSFNDFHPNLKDNADLYILLNSLSGQLSTSTETRRVGFYPGHSTGQAQSLALSSSALESQHSYHNPVSTTISDVNEPLMSTSALGATEAFALDILTPFGLENVGTNVSGSDNNKASLASSLSAASGKKEGELQLRPTPR